MKFSNSKGVRDRNLVVGDICPICHLQYSMKNKIKKCSQSAGNSKIGAIFLRVITFCLKIARKIKLLKIIILFGFFFMESRAAMTKRRLFDPKRRDQSKLQCFLLQLVQLVVT